jgi:hypothetical protein
VQLTNSSSFSSFRHERTNTVEKIYTRMQMQDLLNGFNLNSYNQQITTMGCMVEHIHLDKNTFNILFQKGTICGSLSIILCDSDCVHIYVNKFI